MGSGLLVSVTPISSIVTIRFSAAGSVPSNGDMLPMEFLLEHVLLV